LLQQLVRKDYQEQDDNYQFAETVEEEEILN
jgi:hypothetical protein